MRPTPSPDGRYLAFVRRLRTTDTLKTALFVKDLQSGEERSLYAGSRSRHAGDLGGQRRVSAHGLDAGQQELVFWAGGGIKRIDVASRAVRDIPFHVMGTRESIVPPRFDVAVAPDQVQAQHGALRERSRPTAVASCSNRSVVCG